VGRSWLTLVRVVAAEHLEVELDQVEGAVYCIGYLFIELAKKKAAEEDVVSALMSLEFTAEQAAGLAQSFAHHRPAIEATLASANTGSEKLSTGVGLSPLHQQGVAPAASSTGLPTYRGLDWRLQVQLGSRSLEGGDQICAPDVGDQPRFLLQLGTARSGCEAADQQVILEADYAQLSALHAQLDAALTHARGAKLRRLIRCLRQAD